MVEATGQEALVEFADPDETDYVDPCLTDGKQSWYPFDDGESPAPTDAGGGSISADDRACRPAGRSASRPGRTRELGERRRRSDREN